ncbi:MAG: major facilitator superfamily transporter [Candidatus Nomurabacteria bacterium]|nr:major facilitator superfamily transporter [Candidatus Nomurabacteria bacterium]
MQNSPKKIRSILLVSFLFFAHFSVVMYINSTAVERFVGAEYTSLFYVLGATGSILLLFVLPLIIQRVGLVRVSLAIFLLLAITLIGLGTLTTPIAFITMFVLYTALTSTVWYCTDLFIAHYTQSATAGRTHGLYLTVINTAIALMPVLAGLIVTYTGIASVYIVAAVLLFIAFLILGYSQRNFVDHTYTETTIGSAWNVIRQSPPLRRILSINFLMEFFYAWMTIFTPLYMSLVLHFSWTQIGAVFSFMLLPFMLIQYKVGTLADKLGEKKMLLFGLAIAGISTIAFALLGQYTHSIYFYALVLFCTRVGMCMVEVLSESYFFKRINDQDEAIVSVYRMMRPLAYIVAPLAGWYIISTASYITLFVILGALLLLGMFYAFRLSAE